MTMSPISYRNSLRLQHYTKESYISKGPKGYLYILGENGSILEWKFEENCSTLLPIHIPESFIKLSFGGFEYHNGRILLWSFEGILLWFSLRSAVDAAADFKVNLIDLGCSIIIHSLLLNDGIMSFKGAYTSSVVVTMFNGKNEEFNLYSNFIHTSRIIKRLSFSLQQQQQQQQDEQEEQFLLFSGISIIIVAIRNGKLTHQSEIAKLELNCEKFGYVGDDHPKLFELSPQTTTPLRVVESISNLCSINEDNLDTGISIDENIPLDHQEKMKKDISQNHQDLIAIVSVSSGDLFRIRLSLFQYWNIKSVEHLKIDRVVFMKLYFLCSPSPIQQTLFGNSLSNGGKCLIKLNEPDMNIISIDLPSMISCISPIRKRLSTSFIEYLMLCGESGKSTQLWSMRQGKKNNDLMISLNYFQSDPTIMRGITCIYSLKHFNSDNQNSILVCSFIQKTIIFYQSLNGSFEPINDRLEGFIVLDERTLAIKNIICGRSSILQVTPSYISLFRLPTDLSSLNTSCQGELLSSIGVKDEIILSRIYKDRIYSLSMENILTIYDIISDSIVESENITLKHSFCPLPSMTINDEYIAISIIENSVLLLKHDSNSLSFQEERIINCRNIISDIKLREKSLIVGYYCGVLEEFDLKLLHSLNSDPIVLGCRPVTFPLIDGGDFVLSDGLFHLYPSLQIQSLSSRCDYLVRWSSSDSSGGGGGGGCGDSDSSYGDSYISIEHETLKMFKLFNPGNTSEIMFPLIEKKGMYSYLYYEYNNNPNYKNLSSDGILIVASKDSLGNSSIDLYRTPGQIDDQYESFSPWQIPLHLGKIPSINEGYIVNRMKIISKNQKIFLIVGFGVAEGVGQIRVYLLFLGNNRNLISKTKSPHTNMALLMPLTPNSSFSPSLTKKKGGGGGNQQSPYFSSCSFPISQKECPSSLLLEIASIGLPSPVTDLAIDFSFEKIFILTSCRNELHLLMLEDIIVDNIKADVVAAALDDGIVGSSSCSMTLTNYSSSINQWNTDIDVMVESPNNDLIAISTKMGGLELLSLSMRGGVSMDIEPNLTPYNPGTGSLSMLLNDSSSSSSNGDGDDNGESWCVKRVWCEERRADCIESLTFISNDLIGACDGRGYIILYHLERKGENVSLKKREYYSIKGIPKSICRGGIDDCDLIYTTYSGEIGSIPLKK